MTNYYVCIKSSLSHLASDEPVTLRGVLSLRALGDGNVFASWSRCISTPRDGFEPLQTKDLIGPRS